jgi:hypothetical protein
MWTTPKGDTILLKTGEMVRGEVTGRSLDNTTGYFLLTSQKAVTLTEMLAASTQVHVARRGAIWIETHRNGPKSH